MVVKQFLKKTTFQPRSKYFKNILMTKSGLKNTQNLGIPGASRLLFNNWVKNSLLKSHKYVMRFFIRF